MTDIAPSPNPTEPWAVRKFGLTHYQASFPRCIAGILIGTLVGALVYLLYQSVIYPESFSLGRLRYEARDLAMVFFYTAVGITLVAGLPWWGLHALGFRGPFCAMSLGPILFSILVVVPGIVHMSPAALGWCAGTGLVIWRVAYRRHQPTIDPAIFA